MLKALLGKKIKMTQVFDETGKPVPVTVIKAGPCYVTGLSCKEKQGYDAVQLGFGESKKMTKPQIGRLEKVGIKKRLKYFREFQVEDSEVLKFLKLGSQIDTSVFNEGDKITVSGISKGKGFAGVIKRHGFARGPETHGSDHHRRPGSIGSMFPQRVVKGRKMPGHMGQRRVTIRGLKIIKIIPETNILIVKGAVPGNRGSLLEIKTM